MYVYNMYACMYEYVIPKMINYASKFKSSLTYFNAINF